MRIRMTVAMPEGASRNGEPWPALGEEADVPTADGVHLVASGAAEEVNETSSKAGRRRATAKEVAGGADGGDP